MSPAPTRIPAGTALPLATLVSPTPQGIASRVLFRTGAGSLTLFAFDAGQGLSEHSSPSDALVQVLSGTLILTIGGSVVEAGPGTLVHLPAMVPHAVEAVVPVTMLLTMLREPTPATSPSPVGRA